MNGLKREKNQESLGLKGYSNLSGITKDHLYSISDGMKNKILPAIMSHPANCQLLIHNDNVSKNKKSCITIEELLERIENW